MQKEYLSYPFPARFTTPLAVTHVTIIPMDTDRLLVDQTLLIEGGRIVAMGPSSSFELPSGSTVIEGTGKYLMPGLADMHVHSSSPGDAVLFLVHGVTMVRNMAGTPFHLAFQHHVQQHNLPGPFMVTTGPLLEGAPPVLPTWKVVARSDEAEPIVHACVQRGYQQVKVYNLIQPEVLRALGRAAAALGVRVAGHCPDAMTFEEAIAAGMSCFEHLTGIWRGHLTAGLRQRPDQSNLALEVLQMTINHLDLDAIRRLAHQMAAEQVWNCPTLVALQWMHEAQQVGMAHPSIQPLLKYMPQMALRFWEWLDPSGYRGTSYPQWIDTLHARNLLFSRIVSVLHQEGAPLLIGTDTAVRFVIPGCSVHQELANFVAAGLHPFEALRCATSEAARFLAQEDEWGTVTEGKQANLLLLNKNPLVDIRAVSEVEAVLVNGFFLSRTDLDALLAHQERVASLQPPQSLPSMALGVAQGEGTIVAQGAWIEQTRGQETGRLIYRHRQFADGRWLIEEQYAFEKGDMFSIGGGQRWTRTLYLARDLTIRRATFLQEAFLGSEHTAITWLPSGMYRIRHIELDGHETTRTVSTPPLLPSGQLCATLIPLLLQMNRDTTAWQVLSIDPSEERILKMVAPAVSVASGERGERQQQVQIERPEGTMQQVYHLAADGHFLRMEEDGREFLLEEPPPTVDEQKGESVAL